MLTNYEIEEFISKLLAEQVFLTSKVKDIQDNKDRKVALKKIDHINKMVSLLYDLNN
jgi:hypothetical protein